MMQIKRFVTVAAIVSLLAGSAGIAAAIPTSDADRPTTFSGGNPDAASIAAFIAGAVGGTIAGEGAAPNTCIGQTQDACTGNGILTVVGPGAVQHMDYVVTKLSASAYLYQYQFENTSISVADIITIQAFLYNSIGVLPAADLDASGPHSLITEVEPAICCDSVTPDPLSVAGAGTGLTNASWDAVPAVVVGHETIIMTLVGGAPVFKPWLASDGFTWTSTFANPDGEAGRPVLAPGSLVPEPGSLLLLGSGLIGLGAAVRIARKK